MSENTVNIHIVESDKLFMKVLLRTIGDIETGHDIRIHSHNDGFAFMEDARKSGGRTIYIINDVLPKKSGIELAKYIRTYDKTGVIYFMTRANTEADMIYAVNAGVDNYFTKPFNLGLFQALVRRRIIRGDLA
ncbi:response regulator [Salinicoccus kekensis]|uniref:Response regulator receiver domain-containing protein n=1 Tax=Salinicoccus kekensis TaxID=714307 RepID=A0A285UBU8_9STAP|nr:response regulator [Salinicoccus kekensis]SOC37771.1 response regulator receiver domain-containing protein [Salinicoccus kekensis]